MIEHVRPRLDDLFQRALLAKEIGGQHLDRRIMASPANGRDGLGEMRGAAVFQIVSIDGCDDHMGEAKLRGRFGDANGLARIERSRPAGRNIAEGAGPRADFAQDHEGGVLLLPTFADVGTGRFLTDCGETAFAQELARLPPSGGARRLHSYSRKACAPPVDPVDALFQDDEAFARFHRRRSRGIVVQQIENDGHPKNLRRG